MASNGPPNDELSRSLKQLLAQQPSVPILGQAKPSIKRWQCPKCKTIKTWPPRSLPDGPPFTPPEESILTILPGEVAPTYLCSACDVNVRRRLVPHLQEIDENGDVIDGPIMSVGPGMVLQRPEDVASVGLAKLGIFGDNGAGKTTFLSTIPPELPTLVVSADEENVDQLRGLAHIRVYKIKEWDELRNILTFLAKSPKNPFKVVAFDTWTRLQTLAVNQVVGYKVRDADEAMKFITQIPRTPKGYEAWQNVGALAAEWMRYFERLPMHVVFLMQMMNRRENRDDPDDEGKLGPALTPFALRAAKESLKMLSYIYVDLESSNGSATGEIQLDIEKKTRSSDIDPTMKEVRRLLVGVHPRYATKGPTHKLGYVVDNPTWAKLAPAWDA